jgi:hypothetical protein
VGFGFHTQIWTNYVLTLKPRLKDFLTSCLSQIQVYIWSTTLRYNIDKYMDKIKGKIDISLDPLRVFGQ